jgi:uncharacterized membrane protein
MIDWKAKLSSRKFWVALIGFITAILYGMNYAEVEVEKVASIISAGGVLITYILVEGSIDKQRAQNEIVDDYIDDIEP